MSEVRLKNINKNFGKVIAVKNFGLNIKDGEFVVLVGPSGCGKTTTLRLIAGLEEVAAGEIYIGNELVNDVPPKDRNIAMVFQNYALYPHMNVYRNMAFGLKLRKVPKREIDKIVKRTANLLDIGKLLGRKPKELSGGQRQRVALGRAIVRDPKVFLFDEPLSNLDAKLRIAMRAELLDLHQRLKTTTIYVTHDQMEAMTMGDRIVVMKDGIIQQVDTPQKVYEHPANKYVAGFIGSPSMNFLPCRLIEKDARMCLTDKGFSLRVSPEKARIAKDYLDKEVVLGIRPEHLDVKEGIRDYDPETVFTASVWVVEPLGSENIAHIKKENHTIVCRIDPHTILRTGQTAEFVAHMDLAHIFDKETGKTIF
ncbi:MAG: sn-glycerol-3-phosphate ABC transporter ATP-binding protein UgpC [Candidatus Aerophobetes bacterium]|nr:sn-glycerol-3-phosphate ABC transporter ATP-binding protein UgpC [Candidatus Aerophobetes bacterium]